MKVSTILDLIDSGDMALPEFQRGYVWNREQVRGLMHSLYRAYPVGSLLTWVTRTDVAATRGGGPASDGSVKLLLDGQQRMTTLYGVVRGRPPRFFDGRPEVLKGLFFNLEEESFEFYAPGKMDGNPLWVDVTELIQQGIGAFLARLGALPDMTVERQQGYINRLNAITQVLNVDLHVEEVTGDDKTVDLVVEIFNRVNSGGTKLSKGDLALAKVCAGWPGARDTMKAHLRRWDGAGFDFKLDWLLRNTNALLTGEAMFSALKDVTTSQFKAGLEGTSKCVDHLLNTIGSRLGLDHDRVLAGRYAFPVMVRLLSRNGCKFSDAVQRDQLLHWYIHAFLWGRYAGSVETVLNQDLEAVDQGGLPHLLEQLRTSRGDLRVRPEDFAGYSVGSRFYPMLYLLTRVRGARDFCSGDELKHNLLGKLARLEVHHIFPKKVLYEHGYGRAHVNAVANFCFLTQECNLEIGARRPDEYFQACEGKHPGVLDSQWIPTDRSLWTAHRYLEFLTARRELLAEAANAFLDDLMGGKAPAVDLADGRAFVPTEVVVDEPDEITAEIDDLERFLDNLGYALPDRDVDIADPGSGAVVAVAEAAWLNGLQEGLGEPVVLELDPDPGSEQRLVELGFRVFTSVASLRRYVEARNEGQAFMPSDVVGHGR